MALVYNERIKLPATALNNTAVAVLVTAVIGPIVGLLNGFGAVTNTGWSFLGVLWFLVGIGLHSVAQMVLGSLRP
jgi:hypothetical protein